MATRPQEVSLNLANVKFSSPQHFQIQSLKLTVWFRAVKRRWRRRRDKRKKKKDIYKRGRGQPDNKRLRQSTITSYFPRYRSNQFCPSPKNNRPVPRSVSRRYSRREHSTCRSQVLQDSIQSRSCLTHPRIIEQEKEKEKKKGGKKHGGGVAGSCLIPPLPPFQTSLSSFHLFHGPSTFFCPRSQSQELSFSFLYTLLATRLSLSPSFVIDYGPFETRCRLTGGRKKSATIRISWSY